MSNRAAFLVVVLLMGGLVALGFFSLRSVPVAPAPPGAEPSDEPAPAAAGETWSPERVYAYHPRLFLREHRLRASDGLWALVENDAKARAQLELLKTWCDGMLERDAAVIAASPLAVNALLRRLALCHLLTRQDVHYGKTALDRALRLLTRPSFRDPGYDASRFPATLALVYDWCHDIATGPDLRVLGNDLVKRGAYLHNVLAGESSDAPETLGALAYVGLALSGEGLADEAAAEWCFRFRSAMHQSVLASRADRAPDGAWFVMGPNEQNLLPAIIEWVALWNSAAGEDLLASAPNALRARRCFQRLAVRWPFTIRPDLRSDKYGNRRVAAPAAPAGAFLTLAALTGEPSARFYAQTLLASATEGGLYPSEAAVKAAYEQLIHADVVFPEPQHPASAAVFFPDAQAVYYRSDFSVEGAEKALWVAFRGADGPAASPHAHAGHVTIARGADSLLIDSGYFEGARTSHQVRYFSSPMAHNVVVTEADFAGRTEGRDAARGFGGRIEAFRSGGRFTYARARTVVGEDVFRASECRRDLLIVDDRFVLIVDRVLSRQGRGRKIWLAHTAGSATDTSLGWPTTPAPYDSIAGRIRGGVYEGRNAPFIRVSEGTSAAIIQTLLPEEHIFRLVGGEGYESYVAGANYPPKETLSPAQQATEDVGRYRVEIEPTQPEQESVFVHLITVGADDETAAQEVTRHSKPGGMTFRWRHEGTEYELGVDDSPWGLTFRVRDADTGVVLEELIPAAID